MQLVPATVTKSYLFVWTAHGLILQQIDFDQEFWSVFKNDVTDFYVKLYLPSVYETNSCDKQQGHVNQLEATRLSVIPPMFFHMIYTMSKMLTNAPTVSVVNNA